MEIKEAVEKLEEQGLNLKEDKAIFRLKDGTLEIYFDEDGILEFYFDGDEDKLITEIHDLKIFVSDDLNDRDCMDVAYELAGIDEEDE